MSGTCQIMESILMENYSNSGRKLISLPLEFDHLPVDILAKQFTKLNSLHPFRIHYLGPRFPNTQILHKKYAYTEHSPTAAIAPHHNLEKYKINTKKIITSFTVNQRLRNNTFYKGSLYYRAFEGMNPTLDFNHQFLFDSAFESGNLDCVIQYKPLKYDCFLRIDSNTRGHTQWYYFRVKNGSVMNKIRINLCNISKYCNLYEQGLEPFCFSKKQYLNNKIGWRQGSPCLTEVKFVQKQYRYEILQGKISEKSPYCLSFDYQFQHVDDEVYFAYCIPYTYSEMLRDIEKLPKQYCKIHTFTKSLSGVEMPILFITDRKNQGKISSENDTDDANQTDKKNILITGRVHPGETNSSHMLKGFLEFICSKDPEARGIRQRANIFVIPMLNPDGVILGNTRSSVAGKDLNRTFMKCDRELYPQIMELKNLMKKFSKKKKTFMYFDFHGHSGRKNTFFYGPSYNLTHPNHYKTRVLPKIIESINSSFRFYSCSFNISEAKKTTARAFMFETMSVPFTFTIESSIGLFYDPEKLKSLKFDAQKWNKMGQDVCKGVSLFLEGHEQYELFLIERRNQREKKKAERLLLNHRNTHKFSSFFEEEDQTEAIDAKAPLKIKYMNAEKGIFMKLLNEIKTTESQSNFQKSKNLDEDVSSDEHDENEDLEKTKFKEFNNLVSESTKFSLSTFCDGRKVEIGVRNCEKYSNLNRIDSQNFDEEVDFFKVNTTRPKIKSSCSTRPKYSTICDLSRREKPKTAQRNSRSLCTRDKIVLKKQVKEDRLSLIVKNPSKKKKDLEQNKKWVQLNFPEKCQDQSLELTTTLQHEAIRRVNKLKHAKETSRHNSKEIKMTIVGSQHQLTNQEKLQTKIQQLLVSIERRSRKLKSAAKYSREQKLIENKINFSSLFMGTSPMKQNKSKGKQQTIPVNKKIRKISLDHTPFDIKQCWHQC